MAITEEFNKMNDTTAAKWQRLKNEFEEAFVSDTAQRWLGGLIDGLKWVIDLLIGKSGLSSALFTIITLFGILKLEIISSIWKGFTFVLLKIIDLFKNWRVALELLIIKMKEMDEQQYLHLRENCHKASLGDFSFDEQMDRYFKFLKEKS
jgi:hypothetical protein